MTTENNAPATTDDAADFLELDLPEGTVTTRGMRQPIPVITAPVAAAPVVGLVVPVQTGNAGAPIARVCNCAMGVRTNYPTPAGSVCPVCRGTRIAYVRQGIAASTTPRQVTDEAAELRAQLAMVRGELQRANLELATRRSFVAGAESVATGKFFGFGGQGSIKRAELLAIITAAGLPADLAPGVKTAHAQAGDAITKLNGRGYVVRSDRARPAAGEARTWKARWIVAYQLTDGFTTIGTMALTLDGKLDFAAGFPVGLAEGVRADFESSVAHAEYEAADITAWLKGLFVSTFRAVAVGGNWFVRSKHVADAEALCSALSKRWGRAWLLPAVPMVASDELTDGVISSFVADATTIMDAFICERDAKDETGKATPISKRRAASMLSEVRDLIERCAGFATMFGTTKTNDVKRKLVAIAEEIQGSTDDISTRFGLIFEELARDANR